MFRTNTVLPLLLGAGLLATGLMVQPVMAQAANSQSDWQAPFKLSARTEVRAQTVPAFGGGAAAAGDDGEEKSFRLLTVKHVYVGGIASLFKDVGRVRTEPFVSPASQNGGFGGGGFGGGGFGGGGFGGNRGFGGGGFGRRF